MEYPDLSDEPDPAVIVLRGAKANPASFTERGERMYQHVREGYGADPRAREIAARTVHARSLTAPGLVRRPNPDEDTHVEWFREGIAECDDVFDAEDFDVDSDRHAYDVVMDVIARYEQEGLREAWLAQHAGLDDAPACYAAWLRGWKRCAVGKIEQLRDGRGA